MKTLLVLAALVPSIAWAHTPTCAAFTAHLVGVALGPIQNYPAGLEKGIRREGTAEFIADVGFESLEGNNEGVEYPRIMLFYDRGRFTGTIAIGRVTSEKDRGFDRIVSAVANVAQSKSRTTDGRAVFECEEPMELSVEPTKWDDGPAVKVRVMNAVEHLQTNAYIAEYCSDPKRRRPQDACKK